jgi:hypothetical protein
MNRKEAEYEIETPGVLGKDERTSNYKKEW